MAWGPCQEAGGFASAMWPLLLRRVLPRGVGVSRVSPPRRVPSRHRLGTGWETGRCRLPMQAGTVYC